MEAFTYEVLREEGIRLQVQMDGPGGAQEVLLPSWTTTR